jgi:hypothetical protein
MSGTPEEYFLAAAVDPARSCFDRGLRPRQAVRLRRDLPQTVQDTDLAAPYHPTCGHELGVGG